MSFCVKVSGRGSSCEIVFDSPFSGVTLVSTVFGFVVVSVNLCFFEIFCVYIMMGFSVKFYFQLCFHLFSYFQHFVKFLKRIWGIYLCNAFWYDILNVQEFYPVLGTKLLQYFSSQRGLLRFVWLGI